MTVFENKNEVIQQAKENENEVIQQAKEELTVDKTKNEGLRQMVRDFLVPLLTDPSKWDLPTLVDSFINAVDVCQEYFLPNETVNFEVSDGYKILKVFIGVSEYGNVCSSFSIVEKL